MGHGPRAMGAPHADESSRQLRLSRSGPLGVRKSPKWRGRWAAGDPRDISMQRCPLSNQRRTACPTTRLGRSPASQKHNRTRRPRMAVAGLTPEAPLRLAGRREASHRACRPSRFVDKPASWASWPSVLRRAGWHRAEENSGAVLLCRTRVSAPQPCDVRRPHQSGSEAAALQTCDADVDGEHRAARGRCWTRESPLCEGPGYGSS